MTPHPGGPPGEGVFTALTAEHRGKLMALAREVALPGATRIFEEGEEADRFWVIRSGTVALDIHMPGRGRVVVETIGAGEPARLVMAVPATAVAPRGRDPGPRPRLGIRRRRGP